MFAEFEVGTPPQFPIERVDSYKNDEVIQRFLKHYKTSENDAHFIFHCLKRILWLGGERKRDVRYGLKVPTAFPMLTTMWILDEMWHVFILFTKDYREFCLDYVGEFIDHFPESSSEGEEHGDEVLEAYLGNIDYARDKLSIDDAFDWFHEIPRKFPLEEKERFVRSGTNA